jgi:hypothetical protein
MNKFYCSLVFQKQARHFYNYKTKRNFKQLPVNRKTLNRNLQLFSQNLKYRTFNSMHAKFGFLVYYKFSSPHLSIGFNAVK